MIPQARKLSMASALLAFSLSGPFATAQQVYKWVDENGQVQFTQTPPPNQAEFETRDMSSQQVSDERRAYCAAIRDFAREIATVAARGVPITAANDHVRQVEARYRVDVDQIAMRELVNYVYSNTSRGRYDPSVAGRAHDACLNGSFGKQGRAGGTTADGGTDGRRRAGTSSGTGWVSRGVIVTNHHVVEDRRRLRVRFANGDERPARLLTSSTDDDIALLSVQGDLPDGLPIAPYEGSIGMDVFTLGYPHTDIMGSNAKLTSGIINATTGLRDDPRLYQISVAVQSGNSGGPLVNLNGEVIGVVTAKLSVDAVYRATGDMPQNVNYAVKTYPILKLMNQAGVSVTTSTPVAGSLQELAARYAPSIVVVLAD